LPKKQSLQTSAPTGGGGEAMKEEECAHKNKRFFKWVQFDPLHATDGVLPLDVCPDCNAVVDIDGKVRGWVVSLGEHPLGGLDGSGKYYDVTVENLEKWIAEIEQRVRNLEQPPKRGELK
jgi:hypothetical protein